MKNFVTCFQNCSCFLMTHCWLSNLKWQDKNIQALHFHSSTKEHYSITFYHFLLLTVLTHYFSSLLLFILHWGVLLWWIWASYFYSGTTFVSKSDVEQMAIGLLGFIDLPFVEYLELLANALAILVLLFSVYGIISFISFVPLTFYSLPYFISSCWLAPLIAFMNTSNYKNLNTLADLSKSNLHLCLHVAGRILRKTHIW